MNTYLAEVNSNRALIVYRPKEDLLTSSLVRRTQEAEKRYLETYKALHLGGKETFDSRMIQSIVTICPTLTEEETALRLSNYHKVTGYLSRLSTEELSAFLSTATPLGSGTGGSIFSIEVEDVRVFVKKIRITAIEEKNLGSTSNLYDLPAYYQYGVGSMGFGVWREIRAHEMTTQWVLNGECQNFPLMYHSRILERAALPTPTSEEKILDDIKYWDGSTTVGARIKASDTASSDVIVFMEHIPTTLYKSLSLEISKGDDAAKLAIIKAEKELNLVIAFMRSRGFLHFDAHFHNIMTRDDHVYFADFGLVISQDFDLSPEEMTFFQKHKDYDRYYIIRELVEKAFTTTLGKDEGYASLKEFFLTGKIPDTLPPAYAAMVNRYRPIAMLMHNFFETLCEKSKSTLYPEAELDKEWAKLQTG